MIWNLDKFKDNIALIDENGSNISYGELTAIGDELIGYVGDRCLVFCLCTNSIGSVLGYLSFVNNRIVPLMLNAHMEEGLRDNLIDNYRPKFIWLPDEMSEDICKGYDKSQIKYKAKGYSLIETGFDSDYPIYEDLCMLLTTSGSTGSPKFVRQSYTNVISNTMAIIEYLGIDENERPITTLPMNYTYGLSIINTHIMAGATVLVTDKGLMQKEFWKLFKDEGATSFGGVPYTYEMLERLRFSRMELPKLKYMTQAGGKITPELHKKFAEYADARGIKFIVMYGQCEATARMGYLPADKAIEKCGSMGIVIPGGRFELIDPDGQTINDAFTTGELVYYGDNVTLGYANSFEDLALGDERQGVLHTGDMAQVDEDGYYFIVGRKKRFLKIYGNRVNLDEVDRMIKGNFDNVDVACAGTDDHMFIFIDNEDKKDDIKKYVVNKTKLNPTAFKVIVIDCIPKNDAGKTLYKELERYYN